MLLDRKRSSAATGVDDAMEVTIIIWFENAFDFSQSIRYTEQNIIASISEKEERLMQINSSQIQCFLAVAKTQNFTRAAQDLYISQPVLSRKIASMEEELGLTLFDRSGKNVQLTESGQKMQTFFQKYVKELDALLMELAQERETAEESLKLGIFEGCDLSDFLQSMLFDLHIQYKKFTVTLESGSAMQLQQGLQSGRYDAILMLRVTADALEKAGLIKDIDIDDLFAVEKCVIYSDRNPIAGQKDLNLDSFKGQTLLCLQNDYVPESIVTNKKMFDVAGWMPKIQMLPSLDAVSMALLAGMGFAILDDSTRIFNYKRIHHILLGERHTICLVTQHKKTKAAQVLQAYLLSRYAIG